MLVVVSRRPCFAKPCPVGSTPTSSLTPEGLRPMLRQALSRGIDPHQLRPSAIVVGLCFARPLSRGVAPNQLTDTGGPSALKAI